NVVVVRVLPGDAAVYFTKTNRRTAYIRRDGGSTKLTVDSILSRLQEPWRRSDRQTHQYCSAMSQLIGREREIEEAREFLNSDTPTRVLMLYGLPCTGKTSLAGMGHVSRNLLSDSEKDEKHMDFVSSIDLKGVTSKNVSSHDAMVSIIRQFDPTVSLPADETTPPGTSRARAADDTYSTDLFDVSASGTYGVRDVLGTDDDLYGGLDGVGDEEDMGTEAAHPDSHPASQSHGEYDGVEGIEVLTGMQGPSMSDSESDLRSYVYERNTI
ncbi:LOW QUALITY PROTEIN: hypothetical protein KIPB_009256, partial [Kipferlia bialata]